MLGLDGLPASGQRALAERVRWDRLLALASPNLHPILADRLAPEVTPPEVWGRLRAAHRAAVTTALARRVALRDAVGTLENAGCRPMVLKGAALAYQVYTDPAQRPMEDLDLWVRPEEAHRGADALCAAGFAPTAHAPVSPRLAPRVGPPYLLRHRASPVELELHAAPVSLAGLSHARREAMWSRAQRAMLADVSALVLAPEDLLLHLALHGGALHRFSAGWRSLLDLALVVERWRAHWDWPALEADWHREGVAPWVRASLWLAHRLLGAPVPEAVLESIRRSPARGEVERLAVDQLGHPGPLVPSLWRALFLTGSWRDRGRRLAGLVGGRYRRRTDPEGSRAQARRGRRLVHDALLKLPRDLRAWWRGDLRGARLRARLDLAERRERLERLVLSLEPAGPPAAGRPAAE